MDKLKVVNNGDGDGTSLGIDDDFGIDGGRDYDLITVTHGDPVELRANADFIVKACNSHNELTLALDRIIGKISVQGSVNRNDWRILKAEEILKRVRT